ncbi:MAG TPA: hypothetical protein VJ719_03365, partial [Chthoniobacterales bacterium]|nr:hypothetical protein [Chthoniobacterales bacterium]
MASDYAIAPIFLIRMAGVPFDLLDKLATPRTTFAARKAIAAEKELSSILEELQQIVTALRDQGGAKEYQSLQRALRSKSPERLANFSAFKPWREKLLGIAEAAHLADRMLAGELTAARQHLYTIARDLLPRYLVFADPAMRERVMKQASGPVLPRNKDARAHERHLLLYIQRICAKNDSLSEFGPESWGTADRKIAGVVIDPQPGVAARETFLERWTAHGAAAAMNADPKVRSELAPRIHPNCRLEGDSIVFCDSGESITPTPMQLDLLRQLDPRTPAHVFSDRMDDLALLARENLIKWEVEVPAMDAHAFDTLVTDVRRWRDNPTRSRWLGLLEPIADLPIRFAKNTATESRIQVMDEARAALNQLGVIRGGSNRFLYAAANPIGEECFRRTNFTINPAMFDEVVQQAAPWINLWRDCYAFVADRVSAGLRRLLENSPRQDGRVPLPMFLRFCAERKMPLTGPGLVGFAHLAFHEVKAAFRELFQDRGGLNEWQFTEEDSQFVRRKFQYSSFDEFTYPSADLQLAARSVDAVGRGDYQWILAELHPPVALLHHGFYWSCPDKKGLA